MRLLTAGLVLSSLVTSISSQTIYPGELGYWDVNITYYTDASGYESEEITAIHSMTVDKTISSSWSHDPRTGDFSAARNDRSFEANIKGGCGVGVSVITLRQATEWQLNGRWQGYWLTGTANFTLKVNPVTGRGGTGSVRVNATLDEGAVDACGRQLNHLDT
ncbi:hypothetical protein Hte_005933 [Hypoxylon texense]